MYDVNVRPRLFSANTRAKCIPVNRELVERHTLDPGDRSRRFFHYNSMIANFSNFLFATPKSCFRDNDHDYLNSNSPTRKAV